VKASGGAGSYHTIPLLFDWGLALGLMALAEMQLVLFWRCCGGGRVTYAAVLLTMTETLPLAWRRRCPLAILLGTGSGAAAQLLLRSPITDFGTFGVMVAMYTIAAESRQSVAVPLGAMTPLGVLAAGFVDRSTAPHELMIVCAQFGAAWVIGEVGRHRRRQMSVRAVRIQHENEVRALEAAAAERRRIARELHDVLAHSLSLISIQAGAARSVIDTAPERVRACLLSIETVSAEAWAETRRCFDGAGRKPEAAVASAPGLERLADLVQRLEDAGLSVDLVVAGQARPLSADADLCAYRVVQESLTNALRHATGGRALVTVRYGRSHLEVEVASEGVPRHNGPTSDGPHLGLPGMHERVRAVGGQLSIDADGGRFTVRARLPLAAEA
jgi:signal transduction histidine kinase